MNDWKINFDAFEDESFKDSVGIPQKEIEKARKENLKDYYKEVHICNICNKKYGSDLKEKFFICPDCELKLKGKKKKKLLLKSEKQHLKRRVTTK